MSKNKPFVILSLAALLGLVAALALMGGRGAPTAAGVMDTGLTVPSAGMKFNASMKPQPASGTSVNLAWPNIKVNTDNGNEAQNEPFVAINPNNANHMVVGANSWQSGNGHFEVFAYVTFDGGRTWAASQPYIERNASRLNAADPTVAFGADGTVYFAFVAMTPAQGAVAVSRSVDGGLSWAYQSWATSFTSQADKPAIAAANGKLFLYYQNTSLMGRVSADRAATWGTATTIEAGGRNAAPVVDKNGNVNVFYNTATSIKLARINSVVNVASGYAISTVANVTALQPRAAQYRATIYPAAAVDAKGTLYVAWADGRNAGRGNDILFSRSSNAGASWSAPVTVNTDGTSTDQLMPAVTAGSDGVVTVAWLDNRNDSANINYDVYMARSAGGVSFGANERVSNVSSNPFNDPRTQGTMIGDYFALAAGNGVVYSVWSDTRNNNEDIYMAPIAVPNNN